MLMQCLGRSGIFVDVSEKSYIEIDEDLQEIRFKNEENDTVTHIVINFIEVI